MGEGALSSLGGTGGSRSFRRRRVAKNEEPDERSKNDYDRELTEDEALRKGESVSTGTALAARLTTAERMK